MNLNPKQSSVIVLHELVTDSIILTKRNENLRNHPGEVCFPGGFQDSKDSNLFQTALRELDEELGISANRVTCIKELALEKTLMGVFIHPWLASIETIIPYKLNANEVAKLIKVPMALVLDTANYREFTISRAGKNYQTWQFVPAEEVIWGATARIMVNMASGT